MRALPHTHSCFVCGESNASGLRLRFDTDGHRVQTRFLPHPNHIGFKNTVHGGLIATVLDEIMVWACAIHTRRFAYCAELSIRFAHPLRPGVESIAIGELVNNRRHKLYEAKSELRTASGVLLASATGKYLPVKDTETAEMFSDFIGDSAGWFGPATNALPINGPVPIRNKI